MLTYEILKHQESYIRFEIENGQFEGKVLKSNGLQPCMNLTCGCGNIYFEDQNEQIYALDVEERTLMKFAGDEIITSKADALLEVLQREVKEEQWKELNTFFRDLKGMASEAVDPEKISVDFKDSRNILSESRMIAYLDALPWAFDLDIDIEGEKYIITDFYCIQPSCACTSVLLTISKTIADAPSIEIWLDYRNNTVSLGNVSNNILPTQKIIKEIQENQLEKFKKILRIRHARMRIFFKNYLKREGLPSDFDRPVAQSNIIGRNDPCSCGSGKKYKKCCGK